MWSARAALAPDDRGNNTPPPADNNIFSHCIRFLFISCTCRSHALTVHLFLLFQIADRPFRLGRRVSFLKKKRNFFDTYFIQSTFLSLVHFGASPFFFVSCHPHHSSSSSFFLSRLLWDPVLLRSLRNSCSRPHIMIHAKYENFLAVFIYFFFTPSLLAKCRVGVSSSSTALDISRSNLLCYDLFEAYPMSRDRYLFPYKEQSVIFSTR